MNVGSKNIFQSQTRQGPYSIKLKYLQGRIYLGSIRKSNDICPQQTKMAKTQIKQPVTIF